MCYEIYFKARKPSQERQTERAAPVIEKVPAARPDQRQPVTSPKEKQEIEAELETNAA